MPLFVLAVENGNFYFGIDVAFLWLSCLTVKVSLFRFFSLTELQRVNLNKLSYKVNIIKNVDKKNYVMAIFDHVMEMMSD